MNKLNVLLITTDQQRWDTIASNNPLIETPNIDRLYKRGISFSRAYTCNAVCTPSRVSILTGHYPSKHGCYTIGNSLPADYPTAAQVFSDNDYFTGLIGKAHFRSCIDKTSFEAAPKVHDRDFFRNWTGPYHGFSYAKLAIAHTVESHACGMHYGAWLEDNGVDTSKYFGNYGYTDFGTWDLPEQYSNSHWTADETLDAFEIAQEQEKPFFIWTSFQDPHSPCFVPEPWASMYDREKMPIYSLKDGEMDDKPPFYKSPVEGKGEKYGTDEELRVKKNWGTEHTISNLSFMTDEMKKETMAIYYGMVSQLDHHIGRILDYLEEKNMIDNTLIVFTSDHGDYMGNHGMWWKGLPTYEDMQRLPFVASHPDCKTPGTKSDALQSIVDLPYTFLEVAGIEVPAGYQGVDQNASWIDSSDKVRDWAMVEFRPTESAFMQKTYIEDTYKLVVYHDRNYGELYDIKKDYDQMHNLWDEPEYAQIKCDMIMRFISAEMEKDGKLRPRTAIA
jgi:uncharacterized sulfatase